VAGSGNHLVALKACWHIRNLKKKGEQDGRMTKKEGDWRGDAE
jgi:hypothetical protein